MIKVPTKQQNKMTNRMYTYNLVVLAKYTVSFTFHFRSVCPKSNHYKSYYVHFSREKKIRYTKKAEQMRFHLCHKIRTVYFC